MGMPSDGRAESQWRALVEDPAMSTIGNFRTGFYALQAGAARPMAEALKRKRTGLAFLVVLIAGAMCVPTPARAFSVGFGGIRINVPGVRGAPGYRGHHHSNDHHSGARHHRHDEDDDSADELTKGKTDDRSVRSKLDSNTKAAVDKAGGDKAATDSAGGGASNASTGSSPAPASASVDKAGVDKTAIDSAGDRASNAGAGSSPAPASASNVATTEARILDELNPDFTPER
jgi:hypothetical protein